MDEQLNDSDFDVIMTSLKHYKTNIENYAEYRTYQFKQQQLERVESAMSKMRALAASRR